MILRPDFRIEMPPSPRKWEVEKPVCISGHGPGCGYIGSSFVCDRCQRTVCWCEGGSEAGWENACADCWSAAHSDE